MVCQGVSSVEGVFYSDIVRSRGKREDDSFKGDAGGGGREEEEEEEEQIVAEEGSGAQGRTKKGSSVVV